jgi:hypothetical protein
MSTTDGAGAARRDWWVALGLFVSAVSAAVSSYAGLQSLALAAGWHPWVAPLFPLTVDCLALTAVRVWLARSTRSVRARRYARITAIGAVLLSVAGNATWHLVAADLLDITWTVVVLVGAVPPVTMALVVHLAVLRTQDDEARPQTVPEAGLEPAGATGTVLEPTETVPPLPDTVRGADLPSSNVRRYATEDELLHAARIANAKYQATHGKQITRDALRRELRIGGPRATTLLRRLKEETAQATHTLSIPHHK